MQNTITNKSKLEVRSSKIGKVIHFSQLEVWQLSKELVVFLYLITKKFPSEEKFGLTNQVRRAAISIASNIAEGFGRRTPADKARFYTMACSSAEEVECQILICYELQMINIHSLKTSQEFLIRIKKMLNALISKVKSNCRTSNYQNRTS